MLARNDLDDPIMATPAIAADTLYVRSAGYLWAFADAAMSSPPAGSAAGR